MVEIPTFEEFKQAFANAHTIGNTAIGRMSNPGAIANVENVLLRGVQEDIRVSELIARVNLIDSANIVEHLRPSA